MSASVGEGWRTHQQRDCRHDLTRLAIAALRGLLSDPSIHHVTLGLARQAFDGNDALPGHFDQRAHASSHRLAVGMNNADPADSNAASIFGTSEPKIIAERPQ